jgi:predicted TIM-barrel fold metal-dependent hydrolase
MFKFFSADDHIIEPPGVWVDRLPARLRDVGPHVVHEEGVDRWVWEDSKGAALANISAARPELRDKVRPNEPPPPRAKTYAEAMPGNYDPKERAKDMLENGVVASLCFPSLPRFGGTLFLDFKDMELADLCVKAYNDFVLDEWCPGGPPGMFVPMTICQLWDMEAAVKEIQRCVDRGIRAISIPENLVYFGLPSFYTDYWDPFWRICEEADIAVCMHLATAGNYEAFNPSPEAPHAVFAAVAGASMSQAALLNLIFSPVCTKFPDIKIVFSESGVGWLPFAIGRADLVWERYQGAEERDHHSMGDDGTVQTPPVPLPERLPSEIWKRNMYVCQVEEHIGLHFLDFIGADKVLWELDYPHPDTVWPFAQSFTAEVFKAAELSEEHAEMITHGNAEKLFRWTPAEMPEPATV